MPSITNKTQKDSDDQSSQKNATHPISLVNSVNENTMFQSKECHTMQEKGRGTGLNYSVNFNPSMRIGLQPAKNKKLKLGT